MTLKFKFKFKWHDQSLIKLNSDLDKQKSIIKPKNSKNILIEI